MKQSAKGKDIKREVWGILSLGSALLLALSFFTYDGGDVWLIKDPPNSPQHNWIGPIGAWLGYAAFFSLGYAAFIFPIALATFGIVMFKREQPRSVGVNLLWAAALVVFTACLFQLFFPIKTGTSSVTTSQFTPLGGGGGLGWIIVDGALKKFISRAGAIILVGIFWVVSLVMLTNILPSVHGLSLLALLRGKSSRREEKSAKKVVTAKIEDETPAKLDLPAMEMKDYLADRAKIITDAQRSKEDEPISSPALDEKPPTEPLIQIPAPALPARKAVKKKEKEPQPALPIPQLALGDYEFPPISLLNLPPPIEQREIKDDLKTNADILAATLADFGIEVRVGEVQRGPVITLYEVIPAAGVRVERIAALSNNIALAMRATHVRIQTPIPGKGTVGIEVPNSHSAVVYLREVLEAPEWKARKCKIPMALGKDIAGNTLVVDLASMPHMLIAGATGAGKTVCLNALITSLLYYASPADVRFVMIDPKIVEMQIYNRLPHLWMPVVTEAKRVPLALRKLIDEMEHRYRVFAKVGVRNIAGFNSRVIEPKSVPEVKPTPSANAEEVEATPPPKAAKVEMEIPNKLPYIIIFVDELADVMMVAGKDVEMAVARLAQLARATGIHMVLATQRPSVDVITGVIKANFPSRVAFQVASKQDSRVILDANGADKLIGKGDMLYLPPGSSKLLRAQATYVQDDEIRRTVEFIEKRCPPAFVPEEISLERPEVGENETAGDDEDEELIEQCIEVIRQSKRASVSILQRRLRIGYTRAARIMDIIEDRGIVGPSKGAEPRDILVDLDAEVGDAKEA